MIACFEIVCKLSIIVGMIKSICVRKMIPRIIHQTWKDENVPSKYDKLVQSWKTHHPTWTYRLWTDASIRQLISEQEPQLLAYFDSIRLGVQKADIGRYVILKHHGGFYADLDTECFKSMELIPKFEQHSLIVCPSQQNVIEIAILGSCARHPIWDQVLSDLVENHKRGMSAWNWRTWICKLSVAYQVLVETGPVFFEQRVYAWIRDKKPMHDTICILPSEAFFPMDNLFSWRTYSTQNSYAVHHSFKSWVDSPFDTTFNYLTGTQTGFNLLVTVLMVMLTMIVTWIRKRQEAMLMTTTGQSISQVAQAAHGALPSFSHPDVTCDPSLAEFVRVEWVA